MRRWKVLLDPKAMKELDKLDEQDRIRRFLREKLATGHDPRRLGHALKGPYAGLWTFRVGELRIISDIQDDHVRILVVRIGNRREIYR